MSYSSGDEFTGGYSHCCQAAVIDHGICSECRDQCIEELPRKIDLKLIEDFDLDGLGDYPDFANAFICSASWIDTGRELFEEELDDLNDNYSEYVYELALEACH
jgi:hypothetical protein